jgi:hypothetical protein
MVTTPNSSNSKITPLMPPPPTAVRPFAISSLSFDETSQPQQWEAATTATTIRNQKVR